MKINICGINIPAYKNVVFSIIKIFGIGIKTSIKICKKLNIQNKKLIKLNDLEKKNLIDNIRTIIIENDLKILIKENLKRILNLNNFKSFRHKNKLPCRGQRTKTNAKTRKKMNHENI
ncbi:30S ribosomal protein S13 [Candidatus Carsonella ruddii]|uniref:Small ribosomal subunit protein uS13m n=1 Tax=Carsonella ruddii TaxID=114186 RepID=A0A1U9RSM9_CARRU|nr:30S ribosomal protein S13 [Candidatus Carsonella ruddii]AQU89571.1 SSU ribosomal protein S13p (S18e) [Candidatus Carsonella ruddii]